MRGGPSTYRRRPSLAKKILWALFVAFTVVAAAVPFQPDVAPTFIAGWTVGLALVWYVALRSPQCIVQHLDDTLEFRAIARKRRIAIADLRAIELVSGQERSDYFRFVHAKGALSIATDVDGFGELVAHIKSKNPAVRIVL